MLAENLKSMLWLMSFVLQGLGKTIHPSIRAAVYLNATYCDFCPTSVASVISVFPSVLPHRIKMNIDFNSQWPLINVSFLLILSNKTIK